MSYTHLLDSKETVAPQWLWKVKQASFTSAYGIHISNLKIHQVQ